MSLYNALFGRNQQANLLLAVVGLKASDVQRFRDVRASDDGGEIRVLSRTGGGNRADYPQRLMRSMPAWDRSVDDEFDSTYCTDVLCVGEGWRGDVVNLGDVLEHGIRAEFARYLGQTLHREPTPRDVEARAYESEQNTLARTNHTMANGHTFVPHDDASMRRALELAEKNRGKLRSAWGILPLRLRVRRDEEVFGRYVRLETDAVWQIDHHYWKRCQEKFATEFPLAMRQLDTDVERRLQGEVS